MSNSTTVTLPDHLHMCYRGGGLVHLYDRTKTFDGALCGTFQGSAYPQFGLPKWRAVSVAGTCPKCLRQAGLS